MVDRIGKGGALAREAMQAALKAASERTSQALGPSNGLESAGATGSVDFSDALESGIQKMSSQVNVSENVPRALLTGEINDFHEIAVQLKSAELSFRFAMEIRNKLVDAYREIMRMNV
jgi:flagellar hook-basal body complex protein FliE